MMVEQLEQAKMKSPKVWKIWITTTSSVGTSKFINFVRKSDYDKLVRENKALKRQLNAAV